MGNFKTVRYDSDKFMVVKIRHGDDIHHRVPKSRGGRAIKDNRVTVPIILHWCYNKLFGGSATPEHVAHVLNETWIDKSKKLVVEDR